MPEPASGSQACPSSSSRRPEVLRGAPSLPQRHGGRGPSLPPRRAPASQPALAAQQGPASSASIQQAPEAAQSASQLQHLESNASALAEGSAGPSGPPAAAPAGFLEQPLPPEQIAALQAAIARDPALRAIAAQPDKALSEQLLRTLLSQAAGQQQGTGQPVIQALARRNKPLHAVEQLRGRRPMGQRQQEQQGTLPASPSGQPDPDAAQQQPLALATHRPSKIPGRKQKVNLSGQKTFAQALILHVLYQHSLAAWDR